MDWMGILASLRQAIGCEELEDDGLSLGGWYQFKFSFISRIESKAAFQIGQKNHLLVPKANCLWLAPSLIGDAFIHIA
jgi:hypothetical protein